MARSDWAVMNGSLDGATWGGATVLRDATFGGVTPPGGSPAVFAFNSIESVIGSVGVMSQLTGFAPTTSGAEIQACFQKGVSGGSNGFSTFLFLCSTGSNVSDTAYLLGLEDAEPARIVLAKGVINSGIPNSTDTPTKILRTSTQRYYQNEWVHLRFQAITQPSGDVVLRMYQNDVNSHPLDNPSFWVWNEIEFNDGWNARFGNGYFIDDVTGVNSGSAPLTSGYVGYAFQTEEIARRAYFDHIALTLQG